MVRCGGVWWGVVGCGEGQNNKSGFKQADVAQRPNGEHVPNRPCVFAIHLRDDGCQARFHA